MLEAKITKHNRPGTEANRSGDHVSRMTFQPGAQIFREGEAGTNAFLIESGKVSVTSLRQGHQEQMALLGPGELFGVVALIDGEMRLSTATALAVTVVTVIDRREVLDKLDHADPLLNLFLRNVLQRLRVAHDRMRGRRGGIIAVGNGDGRGDRSYSQQHARALRQLKLQQDLAQGLQRREFELYYQPIFELEGRHIAGFEALVRWRHPDRGLLLPQDFIGLAEDTGLIVPLGDWVLEEACQALLRFGDRHRLGAPGPGAKPPFISINVSTRQFSTPDLLPRISDVLGKTGVDPTRVKLEITESLLMENPDLAAMVLDGVKKLGVRTAIDDFGTGYSSLGYLHRFPIDAIKIDGSFIGTMMDNAGSMEIVRAVTGLARNLGLDIVAEGIETSEQLAVLRALDCALGQGFLVAKPMPAAKALELISE